MRGRSITSRLRRACVAFTLVAPLLALPRAAGAATPFPDGASLTVRGGGWGHGHGMSQYGAFAQAEAGRTYEEILRSYYSGVAIESRANVTMRVLLRSGGATIVGGPEHYVAAWEGGDVIRPRTDEYPYTRVRPGTDGYMVVYRGPSPDGPWDRVRAAQADVLFTSESGIVPVWLNGRTEYYRGTVEAHRHDENSIYTIDRLSMDQYLYGVVPREMPASWPMKALKAQAVAARSYSAWKRRNSPSNAYDICATTSCQVYRGYGVREPGGSLQVLEHPRTNQAVDETSGMTMIDPDEGPIFAEYHSSSGGHTSQGSRSYLAPRADAWDAEHSPYNRWATDLPVARIENQWPQVGELTGIGSVARDGDGPWGGRVTSLKLTGTDGAVTVSGDTFRSAMGLRSTLFTIVVYDAAVAEAPAEVTVAPGGIARATIRMRNTGETTWPVGSTVVLGARGGSPFRATDWLGEALAASLAADVTGGDDRVSPGEVAEVRFTIAAPAGAASGLTSADFTLNARGVGWFGAAATLPIRIATAGDAHLGSNRVGNASFEAASDGAPAAWQIPADAMLVPGAADGKRALRMPGNPDGARATLATLGIAGDAGERYTFAVWNRSVGTSPDGGPIEASVRFVHADGSTTVAETTFPSGPHGWRAREIDVVVPAAFTDVVVRLRVERQAGAVWWDRVRLVRQELRNGSFERGDDAPLDWTLDGATAASGITTRYVRAGRASLQLGALPGSVIAASQTLELAGPAGDLVRVGGWSRSAGTARDGGDVKLQVAFEHPDGSVTRRDVRFPRTPHDWRYAERLVAVSAAYDRVTLRAVVARQSGTAWFDDLVLAPHAQAATLSANPGFELGAPAPGEWRLVNAAGVAGIAALAREGVASLRIEGSTAEARKAVQSLPLAGAAGDAFTLLGWNTTRRSSRDGGAVEVRATFRYADGADETFTLAFPRGEHDWMRRTASIAASKPYVGVTIAVVYAKQSGAAWFDGIRLLPA